VFSEFVALQHIPVRQINCKKLVPNKPGVLINLAAVDEFLDLWQHNAGAGILRPNCDMACMLRTSGSKGTTYALETGLRDLIRVVLIFFGSMVPVLIFVLPSYMSELLYSQYAMDGRRIQVEQIREDPVGAIKHWMFLAQGWTLEGMPARIGYIVGGVVLASCTFFLFWFDPADTSQLFAEHRNTRNLQTHPPQCKYKIRLWSQYV
jgi:hypothetical protein